MTKIDMDFLKKEIGGKTSVRTPLFFIIVFGIVILMLLIGSANSPHDVKFAVYGISGAAGLIFVGGFGIIPLVRLKKNAGGLDPEDIIVRKLPVVEKYKTNDRYWFSFKGEEYDRIVSNSVFYKEFAPGREFYIVEYRTKKSREGSEKLIGVYPADLYEIDTEEIVLERS